MKTKNIIVTPIEDVFGDRFSRYSKYIIQERALPDARDGLKPVQRRILYGMFYEKNFYNRPYLKSAKTVGIVMGNYHPHGDSSIYDAMVRLSQDWKMNHTLVDMQGNNGSIDDDPAAAMRYTEARLTKLAQSMMDDLDKESVNFAYNFDDTTLEPTVLPAAYPNLLVNGSSGIAAGYATNIAPHNFSEIIDATIFRINNPNCSLDELMYFVKGPDFPTGGEVFGIDGIKNAFKNGKGRVVVRGKSEVKSYANMHQITIYEIPFEVNKANLVKKIDDLRLNKDLDSLLNVRDESDRKGLKIVLDVKKDADPNVILNYLYKNTELQIYYNYNMVAIVNQRPEQMGLSQLIDAYIGFREEVIYNRYKFIHNKLLSRLHILEGLIKAVSIMDEIIKVIRASKNKGDAKDNLIKTFDFSEQQAEAIVMLQLYRLTSYDIKDLQEEYKSLMAQKQEAYAIISNVEILRSIVVKELKEVKEEFAQERKTTITKEEAEIELDKTDLISNELVKIVVSRQGYIKRVSLRSYNMSEAKLPGLKENDELINSKEVEMLDTLLIFLDNGQYIYLPVYDVVEFRWNDLGNHLSSYVNNLKSSNVVSVIVVNDFKANKFITLVSESGKVKKSLLENYEVVRYNSPLVTMNLKDDKVVNAFSVSLDDEIMMLTKHGYYTKYSHLEVNETNLRTQGIIGINLEEDDYIVDANALKNDDIGVVVVSERGSIKRLKSESLQQFNRRTKGERIYHQTVSNPQYGKYLIPITIEDSLTFVDDKYQVVKVVDITIMDKDQTFSNPIKLKKSFYILKFIEKIIKTYVEKDQVKLDV